MSEATESAKPPAAPNGDPPAKGRRGWWRIVPKRDLAQLVAIPGVGLAVYAAIEHAWGPALGFYALSLAAGVLPWAERFLVKASPGEGVQAGAKLTDRT